MDYNSVKKTIITRLRKELPKHLTYHSVFHVRDVIKAAEKIALSEGIDDSDLVLIKTAALFHDTGFMYNPKNHEEKSCEIAQEYLPDYGYSEQQIEKIKGMIMATKIPQSPKNKLEEILADADLDYLGRNDFFTIGDTLYQELTHLGVLSNERDWNLLQEKFLENHKYFTPTSIKKRNRKKSQNLTIVKSKLV
jgi:uncharacterized protein